MKKPMINYMKAPKNDEVYTPPYAIYPIVPYIDKDWVIWEPTDFGGSEYTRIFREEGYKVITSHIKDNQNFFEYEPSEPYDIIITNPPYSLKTEFLKRAYELNKRFIFLLPITTLESKARGKIFREYNHDIQLLIFDSRVEFYKGKNSIWFNTSYFCRNVLPQQIIFTALEKQ